MAITVDNSAFAQAFQSRLIRDFGLRRQEAKPSKDTRRAGFKLGPRPTFGKDLYIECRWDVANTDPELEKYERDVARIVFQLKGEHAEQAKDVEHFLASVAPLNLHVLLAQSGGTVYVAEIGLPVLDLSTPPFKQPEAVAEYGRACLRLREFWQLHRASVDHAVEDH